MCKMEMIWFEGIFMRSEFLGYTTWDRFYQTCDETGMDYEPNQSIFTDGDLILVVSEA